MVKPVTNRESVDAFEIDGRGYEAIMGAGPGAFYFDDDFELICIHLPGGHYCAIPLDGSRGWRWDGNKEKPTITPSILQSLTWGPDKVYIELWHGFMTYGRLVSC